MHVPKVLILISPRQKKGTAVKTVDIYILDFLETISGCCLNEENHRQNLLAIDEEAGRLGSFLFYGKRLTNHTGVKDGNTHTLSLSLFSQTLEWR